MRRRTFFFWLLSLCSMGMVPLAASCGGDDGPVARLPPSSGDDDDDTDAGRTTDARADRSTSDGGPPSDGSAGPGQVYAHTNDTLYLFEPVSRSLTRVGKFDCLLGGGEAVIDIAVDRSGNMFATTFDRFLSVNPLTAQCTQIAVATTAVDYPNALSFVPAGTVDPSKEALVGYATKIGDNLAVNYVRIDTTTGVMTPLGNINASDAGPQYRSSGDIISLINDGKRAFATVHARDTTTGSDLLAEIDPANGSIKKILGDTKEEQLYGFGYWAGKGYAFSFNGRIVEVDMTNGSSVVVKTLTDDAGAAVPWYGAGVTTQAPVTR